MNNIKKIGLTALAGSLVTLGSAQAGEMSVSGGINTTLKFGKGGGNTSRSIGTDKDVTFSGGGELDNGTTFSMSTTTNDNFRIISINNNNHNTFIRFIHNGYKYRFSIIHV